MPILPKKRTTGDRVSSIHNLSNKGRAISISKRVPSGSRHVSRGDAFGTRADDSFYENIHFDENKHTILSNFEEWIKLSTDNKITSKNSWQFALIDYFHDLNVIKDGDNINFQRASATLDGCVKIYLSRVESVASETGKLLSGLATKKDGEVEEEEEEDADDSTVTEENRRARRKLNRVLESTLVPFETIQIKKLDQELAIDPLFKKALAEFDEGGAKSLLLNTLSIDSSGRVIFDATTSPNLQPVEQDVKQTMDVDVNVSNLSKFLYKTSPSELNQMSICPSLRELKGVLEDMDSAKTVLNGINQLDKEVYTPSQVEDFGYDYDNDNDFDDAEFMNNDNEEVFTAGDVLTVTTNVLDEDLMAYFDERMKSNWTGPEHWKVSHLKKTKKLDRATPAPEQQEDPKRKKKDTLIINFFDADLGISDDQLFQPPKNILLIQIKEDEDVLEKTNLLPEDIQYNSKRLTNLFTKPLQSIMHFSKKAKASDTNQLTDENFFAEKYKTEEEERKQQELAASFQQAEYEDYDNDDFGGIDFNDALMNDAEVKNEEEKTLLPRKARPEYVNFSRVAKRVDVKLLKDNLWSSINEKGEEPEPTEELSEVKEEEKTFAGVVSAISKKYQPEERKDLSTSFCFICLLHLANEHGLEIAGTSAHDDLRIKGF